MNNGGIRVLHVDDDSDFTDLSTTFLEREDDQFSVETATSAADGLDIINDRQPDCVVSDYNMPGIDGIGFLQAVREECPDLPFILFTGKGSEAIASEAIAAGVTGYLQKGSSTEQYKLLANRIKTAVGQYRAERELERQTDLFAKAQDIADVGAWAYDTESGTLTWTDQVYEIHGVSKEFDPSLEGVLQLYHPDDQPKLREAIDQAVTAAQPSDLEVRMTARDDGTRWLQTVADPQIEDGTVVQVRGTVHDITERKEQKHQLERKNARLSALFEQFPEPTFAYAHEGGEPHIRQVNEAFTETFGYDAGESIGAHVDSLVVPPDRQTEAEQIDERVKAGEAIDEVLRRQTQDEMREFRFRNIPLANTDTIDGYAIYADVTERKRRERELQRKERIIQETNDGVVVVQNQTVTYTNPQLSEIIGYPSEELEGEPVGRFIAPEDRETVRRRYKQRLAGNEPPKTYEISLLTRDGETVPVEITAAQVTDVDEPSTVSIVRDISDRKEQVDELERQNERLEEFASIASHDLRNPLNVASSRLELARDTCDSPHLAGIADAHERMEQLIDDLLTLARQGEEVREMESVSVTALAGECWNSVATAEAKLKTDADVTIRADRSRLQQAVENLIRNAVEHGGHEVTVWIGDLAEESGFYVADDGPGIPEDSHDEVLESGYSTIRNGTGFGLAIVREIVEAHDWKITVTDSDEDGARFEITCVDIVD